jgi:hypothetical protein
MMAMQKKVHEGIERHERTETPGAKAQGSKTDTAKHANYPRDARLACIDGKEQWPFDYPDG